jgi:hypothetical protein
MWNCLCSFSGTQKQKGWEPLVYIIKNIKNIRHDNYEPWQYNSDILEQKPAKLELLVEDYFLKIFRTL